MKASKGDYRYVLQGDYGHGHGFEDLMAVEKSERESLKKIRAYKLEYLREDRHVKRLRIVQRRIPKTIDNMGE